MWAGLKSYPNQVHVHVLFPLFKTHPKNAHVHTSPRRPLNVAMICGFRILRSIQKRPQPCHVRRRSPGSRYLSPYRFFSPLFLQEHENLSVLPKQLRNMIMPFPKIHMEDIQCLFLGLSFRQELFENQLRRTCMC